MLHKRTLLALIGTIATLSLLIAVLPVPQASESVASGDATLVIDNARYFDGERMHGPAAIVIADGRIAAIEAAGGGPADVERIDATGQTVLPGLIDAHVHTFASARRDAVPFGVTTMLDMFMPPATLDGLREARESRAPTNEADVFSAGMLATVDGGHGTQYGIEIETLSGPADAPAWVARRLAEGSDYIKLVFMPGAPTTPSLDLATATAVIDAAHAAGVMAVAHISRLEDARALLDAGVDGFVHIFADAPADEAFIRHAVAEGVFVVPTAAVIAMVGGESLGPALAEDEHLGPLLTPSAATNLKQDFGYTIPGFELATALDNIARLHAAGVPVLAGSDAPNPGTAHGATLHAEMALFVRAGLSPIDALAAATSAPAKAFGLSGRGRIAPGARADLVLVDGEPDRDILATRRISRVLRNGAVVDATSPASAELGLTLPPLLGDFDDDIVGPAGTTWQPTSDTMMGGESKATLSRTERGDGGALAIDATVSSGFAFPWAGAYFGPATEGAVADLSDWRAIRFDVRGTPDDYRLMMFVAGSLGAPPIASIAVTEDWQTITVALADVRGFEAERFAGLALVTPMKSGEFHFEIDNVTLLPVTDEQP